VFTPGSRLWRGLISINEYIEHYGTGGGLSRPLFSEFLVEAGEALGTEPLTTLGERYAELGRERSALAGAALPDDVPAMRQRLDELARSAQERFPLSDSAVADLRADLERRVLALHDAEVAAHAAVSTVLAGGR
jgi:hypothetical protein